VRDVKDFVEPGDVHHLRRDRTAPVALVEAARDVEPGPEESRIQELAVDRHRQRVPHDVASRDRGLDASPRRALRPLESGIDQPRARRPDEAFGPSARAKRFGQVERGGKEALDVAVHHPPREVREAHVEVRLEDDVQIRDVLVPAALAHRISRLPALAPAS
jgi:hypothetical protein